MEIYNILKKSLASLAIMLACNGVFAEIIEGENPDNIYVCAYETLSSTTFQAKKAAQKKAELSAMNEFIIYAVKENLIIPEKLDYLSEQIKKSLYISSAKGNIKGAKVIRSLILKDGRAVCVLEIPKTNLKNFESLNASISPGNLLKNIYNPKVLRLEIVLALGIEDGFVFSSSPLSRAVEKKALNGISFLWIEDMDITPEFISNMDDSQLYLNVEASLGFDDIQTLLLAEVEKRGYLKSAKFLAGHEIPTKDTLPACDEFLATLDLEKLNFSKLSKILIKNKCSIDFANIETENKSFNDAQTEFSKMNPDFNKVIELIHASFLDNLSDDSMNLLGRCYEEQEKFNEALICYFQALSINQSQAYVKLNLANAFYALGNSENALFWAKDTISDTTSSSWSKDEAKKLVEKIEISQREEELTQEVEPSKDEEIEEKSEVETESHK